MSCHTTVPTPASALTNVWRSANGPNALIEMVKGRLTRPYHRFGPAAAHPRWTRLGAAALATLFLATGFGVIAELFAGGAPDSTLRLTSVSATQLDQLGIKLVATRPPPYCALSDAVNDRGWAQR